MLHEFLSANHQELAERCRAKVALRPVPSATPEELEFGIPLFIQQLANTLRLEQHHKLKPDDKLPPDIGSTAGKHGNELLRHGYTIDQVVHDYGDLCQAVTELAQEKKEPITVDEFHTFNRCLDNAIADAVTEFGRQRDQFISEEDTQTMNEQLGALSRDFRILLNSAMLAFEAIKSGNVALTGATGGVLGRSLIGLRALIDRSLADVRLMNGLQARWKPISVRQLFDEIQIAAAMEAKVRGLEFATSLADEKLTIDADRQMLTSAVANLLQNAFTFTRPNGHVMLRAQAVAGRVLIDIEDECGGLAPGKAEALFQALDQPSGHRPTVGVGLSLSRRAVEANGGTLHARNLPGTGCVFTIDLPAGTGAVTE